MLVAHSTFDGGNSDEDDQKNWKEGKVAHILRKDDSRKGCTNTYR